MRSGGAQIYYAATWNETKIGTCFLPAAMGSTRQFQFIKMNSIKLTTFPALP
jgi:hypothetical protein